MQQQLSAGTAQTIIDPPPGTEMSGFAARRGRSQDVHDHLWAKALVVTDGAEKLAIVMADLVGIDDEIVTAVRNQTAEITDIKPDRVMVGATHTHSGPAVIKRGYLGKPDPAYLTLLIRNLAGAAVLANQNLEPVECWIGEGECPIVGKNRRIPGGSTDPQLLVWRLDGAAGIKTIVVNYACHPVVLGPDNLRISADYPFYLRNTLESIYPGAQIIFINGATGDINTGHSAHSSIHGAPATQSKRTFAEAERLGRILAGQALSAAENAIKQENIQIKFHRERLDLRTDPIPSLAEYQELIAQWDEKARKLAENQGPFGQLKTAQIMGQWARDMKERAAAGLINHYIATEVVAFAIGDFEFATLPGEFFHELGLQLKMARSPQKLMLLGYSNGNVGYVANRPAYAEGGYEVDESYPFYGLPARLAQGSGERVIETLQNALRIIRE